jgi:hypothetical protein
MMMKKSKLSIWKTLVGLGATVVLTGCGGPQPEAVETSEKVTPQEASAVEETVATENAYTHELTVETPYYTEGPQQARPPDGIMQAGTKAKIVEDAGSYALIEMEDGTKAYVIADSLKKLSP